MINKQKSEPLLIRSLLSGPGGIQTPNLLIRSQMLYSVKLRNHFFSGAKITKLAYFKREIMNFLLVAYRLTHALMCQPVCFPFCSSP